MTTIAPAGKRLPLCLIPALVQLLALPLFAGEKISQHQPGSHDEAIKREFQLVLAHDIVPGKSTLNDLLPQLRVEPAGALSWKEAVDHADRKYANDALARLLFLRNYLKRGSPVKHLDDLKLVNLRPDKAPASLALPFEGQHPKVLLNCEISYTTAEPTLSCTPELKFNAISAKDVDFSQLVFDAENVLIRFICLLEPDNESFRVMVVGNPQTKFGGVIRAGGAQLERIGFNERLEILFREIYDSDGSMRFIDSFNAGKLSKREHYKQIKVNGKIDEIVEKTERF